MFAELLAKRGQMDPALFAELMQMQREVNPAGDIDPVTGRSQNEGYGFDFSRVGGPANPYVAAAGTAGGQVSPQDANSYSPAQWMADNGYRLMQGPAGDKLWGRYLLDANGNQVGGTQTYDLRGEEANSYRNMAMILGAGAAAGGAFDGLGAASNSVGGGVNGGVDSAALGLDHLGTFADAASPSAQVLGGGSAGGFGMPVADGLAGASAGAGTGGITAESLGSLTGEQIQALLSDGGATAGGTAGGAAGGLGSLGSSVGSLLENKGAAAGFNALGSVLGKQAKNNAAAGASSAQFGAAKLGIDETRRQFDFMQELLSPFVKTGTAAIGGMGNLAGLGGASAQQAAIDALKSSPAFTSQLESGQNAILQNASATGGLRGGNTQSALAQFSPALLAQTINDQYSRLGGLAGLGQASAAGVGNAALGTGSAISGLLGQQGSAQAGLSLARGQNTADMFSSFAQLIGRNQALGGGF